MAEKSIRPEKVLRIIGLSLFGVAILLALIGCFGDIFKSVTTQTSAQTPLSYSQTYSFTWLFKDMWKELDALKVVVPEALTSHAPLYPYQLILSILTLIAYLACLGGVTSILIVLLVKFVNKPNVDDIEVSKFSKLLTISVVPFLITVMMLRFAYISQTYRDGGPSFYEVKNTFGWGTILLIIAILIGVVASAFGSIKDNIDKNSVVHNILTKVSMFVLVFVVIFGFRNVASIGTQGSYFSSEENLGILALLSICSAKYRIYDPSIGEYTKTVTASGATTLAVFAMIFLIAIACFVVLTFRAKKTSTKIVFLALIFGLSIMSGIFGQTALEQLNSTFRKYSMSFGTPKFGSAPIVTAVLSGVTLVITCVSSKFAPQTAPKKIEAKK